MIQQESGKVKGKLRLGRIVKAEPSDRDGAVRKVDIQYKNPESKSFVTVTRAVKRVFVISPIEHDVEYDEFIKDATQSHQ